MRMRKRGMCLLMALLIGMNLFAVMPMTASAATGADIANYAKNVQGTYRKSNESRTGPTTFDCSGFVWYVFSKCGVSISNGNTEDQRKYGTAVDFKALKSSNNYSNLKEGDLLFFDWSKGNVSGHVGIYIGGGKIRHAWGSGGTPIATSNLSDWGTNNGFIYQYVCDVRRIVNGGAHTHNYTGSHYEAAHPHRVYQTCSCGATRYTGGTTTMSSCKQCTQPGKPAFTSTEAYHDSNVGVAFCWSSTVNTTHYNLYIAKKDTNGVYQTYHNEFYAASGFWKDLPVGEYKAVVQSTNSKVSGWPWTNSDDYYFSVGNQYMVRYRYVNGNYGIRMRYPATHTIQKEINNYSLEHPDGYRFLGWATKENAVNVEYYVGDVYDGRKDLTLYPVWERPSTCGDAVTWRFDQTTGELVIQGSGDMYDYEDNYDDDNCPPWNDFKDDIKKVTVRTGVTGIGNHAFNDCAALTAVSLPDGLRRIGDWAFSNCIGLHAVSLPDSVETIDYCAFYDCTNLADVPLPNGVKQIGVNAFSGCPDVDRVLISESVVTLYSSSFQATKEFLVDEANPAYAAEDGVLFNKEKTKLIRYPDKKEDTDYRIPDGVTQINRDAFKNDFLKNLTIPGTIQHFESLPIYPVGTFTYLRNLTSVVILDGMTKIDDYAFCSCRLTSITIPDSVTDIGNYAFWRCGSLTEINLPDHLTSIGNGAFVDCNALSSLDIPVSVTNIGTTAFKGCRKLTSIHLPKNVAQIGKRAFSLCNSLAEITVDESNAHFTAEDGVLFTNDKTELLRYPPQKTGNTYNVPDTVNRIADTAFESCQYLKTITLPNSVATIGVDAFYGCSSLQSMVIPQGVVSIGGGALSYCTGLISIILPDSVSSMGTGVFNGCKKLTGVILPSRITEIPYYTFSGCSSLVSVTIPGGVTSIDRRAFENCNALHDVYFGGSREEWELLMTDQYDGSALRNATIHYREMGAVEEAAWEQPLQVTPTYAGKVSLQKQVTDGKAEIILTPLTGTAADYADIKLFTTSSTEYEPVANVQGVPGVVSGNTVTFSFSLPHYDAYRILLWDEHMTPVAEPITVTP